MNPKYGNTLASILFVCFFHSGCGLLYDDRSDKSIEEGLPGLSDSIISVDLPEHDPQPIITIGNGTSAGCTAEILEKALDSLSRLKKGGTIRFSCGERPVVIKLQRPLKIGVRDSAVLIDGGGVVTLDGNNRCRIIECRHYANLILKNISIVNGLTDSSGAGILHPWYGKLVCINTSFINNNCTVTGPEFGGGGVFAGGLRKAYFFKCIFKNNRASNGGAVLNRGTNLIIDSCVFEDNTASGDGGGKDAGEPGRGGLGGAVYIDGMNYDNAEPFVLRGSTFTNNISHCHGSAVFSYYYKDKPGTSAAFIEACGFYDNSDSGVSTTSTGTLYHEGAPLKLHASSFCRNTTLKHAGALFLGPDSPTEIVNCTFYGNKTPGNGGAIFAGKQRVVIRNCTFFGNEASYGPAIFNDTPDAVSVYNTIFCNNIPVTNQYAYRNCTATYSAGENVFQWPAEKANGKPDNPCIKEALFKDPLLDTLAFNGGSTLNMALSERSTALDICENCPPVDQRGRPRKTPCDAGAYERD